MTRLVAILMAVGMSMMIAVPSASQSTNDLAVIVHPDNPTSNLSFAEFRRIARLEQQFWNDNTPISLLIPGANTSERSRTLKRVYQMSEQAFRQHWISVAYQVKATSLPRPFSSCEVAVEVVSRLSEAVSMVSSSCLDQQFRERVKVVRIDGRLPNEDGYRL